MEKEGNVNEYDGLCRLIDLNNVISFDIYDTALLRNVIEPTDIFEIISIKLRDKEINIPDFKKIRIQAEIEARKNSNFEDISLDDIYVEVGRKIGNVLITSKIKELELEIEREFTVCNKFIKKIYDYAVKTNKKIIFISDMYLPFEFISKLLTENGFTKYDHLYVSGAVKLSKASGRLYNYIRETENISDSWLHIGDNYKVDYVQAKKLNINAYYYKDLKKRVLSSNNKPNCIEKSVMKAIQINFCEVNDFLNYWNRFGIYIVSSLFFGFTQWIVKDIKGKENIYFLSRDGYLPYKIYLKLSKVDCNLPDARYIYASRKAYQIPSLIDMNQDEVLNFLTSYNSEVNQKLSIGEIFNNVNLEKANYLALIKQFGFKDFNDYIKSEKERNKMKEILKIIYPDIMKAIKNDRLLLKKYLKQNDVYNHSVINLVDVGWRGSSQKAIDAITNINTYGYYFGNANISKDLTKNITGYAFHLGKPYSHYKSIMDNVMMYELIFSAPHGTLERFTEDNGSVIPILSEVEDAHTYEVINNIHSGVLSIVDEYIKYNDYLKDIRREDCLSDYFEFINAQKYEDLCQFSNLKAVVGIGNTQEKQCFVTSVSISEYISNKKNIKSQVSKNLWKNALIVKGSLAEFKRGRISSWYYKLSVEIRRLHRNMIKAIHNPKKAFTTLSDIFFSNFTKKN